jgi:hypothetical protein
MPELFGRLISRSDLAQRTGDAGQLGGIRESVLQGGRAGGVRALDVTTGSGLTFMVLPDRCLDICAATFQGASVCWHSPAGIAHPAYYEPEGQGWLWGFFGGLMTTCGLTQVGSPNVDEGEHLGQHGRIADVPAEHVRWGSDWEGDELTYWIAGTMREARLFGPDLRLHRRITTRLGGLSLRVENTVENAGFSRSPLMILFHCNAGYPLLDDGAELLLATSQVTPRDDQARAGLAEWSRFPGPQPGWQEQVFYHEVLADAERWCSAAVVNRRFGGGRGLGLVVRWRGDQLFRFGEWKMTGQGAYVVGLEPANCGVAGRHAAREDGTLQFLEPQQSLKFELEFQILPDSAAIEREASQTRRLSQR